MRKVCILTFHFPQNFGAQLQCFALKTYLEVNNDVEIIDYRPKYHVQIYKTFRNPFYGIYNSIHLDGSFFYKIKRSIRSFGSILLSNIYWRVRKINQEKSDEFISENFKLTKKYSSLEELKMNPPVADVYVCGSDQVWNPIITNKMVDIAYLLDFGDKKIQRIGYAISENFDEKNIQDNIHLLENFDFLSFRETKSVLKFEKFGIKSSIVLDPTLLLKREEYTCYKKYNGNLPERFICVYALKNSKDLSSLINLIERVSKLTSLPIVDISPYKIKLMDSIKITVGPGEFLDIINRSSYVLSNSFHGTVFSLIYNKNFYVSLPNLKRDRIESLLSMLDLSDRIIEDCDTPNLNVLLDIEFSKVNEKLDELRNDSFQFLKRSLK